MDRIKTIMKVHYNTDITNIRSLKGGWASLAYQVSNNNNQFFLKVYEKSRSSTRQLTRSINNYVPIIEWLTHNSELKEKISVPLLADDGSYKCEDDYGIYLLYDYINGETIGNQELKDTQVYQLSGIISTLHSYGQEIPIDTSSIKENFEVPFLQFFSNILKRENNQIPIEIRESVSSCIPQLKDVINKVEKLAAYLKNSDLRMALCHTDLHNWNLMQTSKQLILVDWEGLKIAPVEADLMFFVNKPYFNTFLRRYQETHKNFKLNLDALHFYQGRRKLEDLGELLEQLLFDSLNEQGRVVTINYIKEELRTLNECFYEE